MNGFKTPHEETHKSHRAAWLRAAVLGVNDGVVSTASLMVGVSAAAASKSAILTAGIAGLSAGALSMAAGEYVSVSSQRDSERADIAIEERSLAANPEGELAELAWIYEQRGLDPVLAKKVAAQLHKHDAVAAHARDELGIDHESLANPMQASVASASSFAFGAIVPILATILLSGGKGSSTAIVIASLIALAISGAIGAAIGGGHRLLAAGRVLVGGGLAMAVTAFIGHLIGASL
ncbi:MAG TPA: VIT family protein [Candidatus Pristimantibacillus sp.]|jgi:VIT1/CCC1 family predicted Fe2+/Mn2+ transporter|nr:VIT family protein [Candidatus Pristimantibacillus sp.]